MRQAEGGTGRVPGENWAKPSQGMDAGPSHALALSPPPTIEEKTEKEPLGGMREAESSEGRGKR